MPLSFDDSLPCFIQELRKADVDASDAAGVVIRDVRGRLSFVARIALSADVILRVDSAISEELKPYISPIGAVADVNSPGAARVLEDKTPIWSTVYLREDQVSVNIRFLDRRAIGMDWLYPPSEPISSPPRLVFSSLKGGVGRSTALAILAAELAEQGRSVLVVDLDMEAPGLGSMLIEREALPFFGTIDYFVESGLKDLGDEFLLDCVGASWVGGGRGRIDVVPAFGSKSIGNPADVLSKLARAYLEDGGSEERPVTFLTRARDLLERLTSLARYDAVLVDARAGLHETSAAGILGLGADVLLFGVDQPQTQDTLSVLLSHLAQFPVLDPEYDWRDRFRVIQAKADPEETTLISFRSQTFDLFEKTIYSREPLLDYGIDDANGPHFPIPIFEDERYRLFHPLRHSAQLTRDVYSKSFTAFLEFATDRLKLNEENTQ
jgi:hypothetical protein